MEERRKEQNWLTVGTAVAFSLSRIHRLVWSESTNELYRPSDRRLSAKLVPTFADRVCHVLSVTNPYGCNLDFLDQSRYFSFK
jgi:hypothetical protein